MEVSNISPDLVRILLKIKYTLSGNTAYKTILLQCEETKYLLEICALASIEIVEISPVDGQIFQQNKCEFVLTTTGTEEASPDTAPAPIAPASSGAA